VVASLVFAAPLETKLKCSAWTEKDGHGVQFGSLSSLGIDLALSSPRLVRSHWEMASLGRGIVTKYDDSPDSSYMFHMISNLPSDIASVVTHNGRQEQKLSIVISCFDTILLLQSH
jgi:hypothetical protein